MNVGVKCCLETCGKWMHTCEVTSVVSNSLRPYGLKPARLLCLWDSPGKNTGISCHALLLQIFPTWGSNTCLCTDKQILYH